jgi:polyisoprenoid-binding protein YceI
MKGTLLILIEMLIASAAFGAGPCVVADRGRFQIHVGTGGLFGPFAHDHLIQAERIMGCATIDTKDVAHSSIALEFPAASVRVIDPKASAKDRADVQKTMENEVLHVAEFAKITFESVGIERGQSPDSFRVRGTLTIRGKTQPAVIPLTFTRLPDGTYRAVGEYRFKQTSFGIKPIQLAGGTVKVKDEIGVEFELFLK